MRLSTKFSDTIHLLAFLQVYSDIKLTSAVIAASIQTSPVVVRRLIGALKNAGFVDNDPQSHNPRIAVDPKDITLLDIYLITEGHTPLFVVDKETNPLCRVGGNIQPVLTNIYGEAEQAALTVLNSKTMQDIIDSLIVHNKVKQAKEKSDLAQDA